MPFPSQQVPSKYETRDKVLGLSINDGRKWSRRYSSCNCKKFEVSTVLVSNSSKMDPKNLLLLFQLPFSTTSIHKTKRDESSGSFYLYLIRRRSIFHIFHNYNNCISSDINLIANDGTLGREHAAWYTHHMIRSSRGCLVS